MIQTPPSSSTLSPLAPPFNVDRFNNSNHRLHPYGYPLPSPSVPEFNIDASLPAKSTEESSSWMDPSLSYNVSPFSAGGAAGSFMTYGDAYGSWHGKHDSSEGPVHIGADSSAWQDECPAIYQDKARVSCNNGSTYFQFSNPNLSVDECHTSNSNPSYDRYLSQLVSCSTDPITYYPPNTCSSSPKELSPAKETNSSMYFVPKNWYSTAQHGNLLYNVDDNYVDHMLGKKEPGMKQYSDDKDGHANDNIEDNGMKGNNRTTNFLIAKGCSSLGKEVTTVNPKVYSTEMTYGFESNQLNFTESIASSSRPNISLRISSEILDQPHLALDSPCWKGASVSHHPFGVCDGMIDCHLEEEELKISDDLDQVRKCLPISDQCTRTSNYEEKDGLFCYGNMKGPLPVLGNFSPSISGHATDDILHDFNAKGSEHRQVGEERRRHVPCIISDKCNEVKGLEEDSERVNGNVKELGQVRTVISSAVRPSLEGEGVAAETGLIDGAQENLPNINHDPENHIQEFLVPEADLGQVVEPLELTDPTGKSLTTGNDTRLLLQSMHGLSELLLSSSYSGVIECKGRDHELVQLVINNLETFNSSRNRKVSVPKSSDNVNKYNSTRSLDTEGKFQLTDSCMNNDTLHIRRSKGIAQVAVKDLESDIFAKKEDNFQAALYKNLWMQAEAALCSMKYELQLAHMKLEMKDNDQTKEKEETVQVKKSPRLSSTPCSNTPEFTTTKSLHAFYPVENDAVKSSEAKPKEQNTSVDDKVEATVMARLEILKGRYARSDNISIEEQPKCSDTENMLKDLPTKLSDLGFVESRTPQPFADGDIIPKYNEENYLLNHSSRHPFDGGSLGLIADSPFPQPFLPSLGSQRNPMRFFLG